MLGGAGGSEFEQQQQRRIVFMPASDPQAFGLNLVLPLVLGSTAGAARCVCHHSLEAPSDDECTYGLDAHSQNEFDEDFKPKQGYYSCVGSRTPWSRQRCRVFHASSDDFQMAPWAASWRNRGGR